LNSTLRLRQWCRGYHGDHDQAEYYEEEAEPKSGHAAAFRVANDEARDTANYAGHGPYQDNDANHGQKDIAPLLHRSTRSGTATDLLWNSDRPVLERRQTCSGTATDLL
jgi:hypothetical protein